MKTREVQCIYYEFEGSCQKGHKGLFRSTCQHCLHYRPMRGKEPARKNLKKTKQYKIADDRRYWDT
jgi:hypothetical protein